MIKRSRDEISSSEDIYTMTLKEVANPDFLKCLFLSNQRSTIKKKTTNYLKNGIELQNFNTYQLYNDGLSESQKYFIAKKLNKRLENYIIIENKTNSRKNQTYGPKEFSGIKLLTESNFILTDVNKKCQHYDKERKLNTISNKKANFFKCQEIATNTEQIFSKQDLKYWVHRKPSKKFKYRKIKTGILLEIK